MRDDTFLLLSNAHHEAIRFNLPTAEWKFVLSTSRDEPTLKEGSVLLEARSMSLLSRR